jgi:hypothetical protein
LLLLASEVIALTGYLVVGQQPILELVMPAIYLVGMSLSRLVTDVPSRRIQA